MKNKYLSLIIMICLVATFLSCNGQSVRASEYEETPSHTKTVTITSQTQTDVGYPLFTVDKWGKLVYELTCSDTSDLDVRINFWTVELTEAIQADYGDLGWESIYSWETFPIIDSCNCELYWVEDENLPVSIYYEVDRTKNPDHNINEGSPLIMTLKYYDLMGDEGTKTPAGLIAIVTAIIGLAMVRRLRKKN